MINPANITITTSSLPDGTKGTSYRTGLSANVSGVTWSVSSGSLPAGLTLNSSSGVISGTPSESGEFTFAVTAKNSYGSGARTFTIRIYESGSQNVSKSSGGRGGCDSGTGFAGCVLISAFAFIRRKR